MGSNYFPNFSGCTVEVWECLSNFFTHFTGHVVTYLWALIQQLLIYEHLVQQTVYRMKYAGCSFVVLCFIQGLHSLNGKTSYRKILWILEAARFRFKFFQSLWNLVGTSATLLPMCLSNFRAIRPLQHPISRLRGFTRFVGKTSYRLVNRGPGYVVSFYWIHINHLSIFFRVVS